MVQYGLNFDFGAEEVFQYELGTTLLLYICVFFFDILGGSRGLTAHRFNHLQVIWFRLFILSSGWSIIF